VAAPVSEAWPMSLTGRRLVSVKYPGQQLDRGRHQTMPISTAPNAIHRGLPL